MSLPGVGRMSRVLTFGKRSRPKCIVVMLHGLNDSAECCAEGVAQKWAEALEHALVVVPQSPDQSIWSSREDPGYDWLRQRGSHDTRDEEANVLELQRAVRVRMRHLGAWLRTLLAKHNLGSNRLILAGFSQGSILAALCAVQLRALGSIVCGGITGQPIYSMKDRGYVGGGWMRWEELLPSSLPTPPVTRFCAINGTNDVYVPRRSLERMLAPFECYWHWDRGVGHDFPDSWYAVALQWMQRLLDQ